GAGAVRLAEGGSTGDVLRALVEEATVATRAAAALMLLEDPDGTLRVAASHGLPDTLPDLVRRTPTRLDQLPAGELLLRGSAGFLSDDRDRLGANGHTRSWLAATDGIAWRGAAKIPIRRDGRVAGCMVVL